MAIVLIAAAVLGVQYFLLESHDGPEETVPGEELVFRSPEGLMMGEDGTLYVADSGLHTILTLAAGEADRVAGVALPQVGGIIPGAYSDGSATQALFNGPTGMVSWLGGIVISDTGNNRLRFLKKIAPFRLWPVPASRGVKMGTSTAPPSISPGGWQWGATALFMWPTVATAISGG